MKSTGFWKSQTKPTPASSGVSSSATSCPKWRNFFSMRHESRAWKPASRMPPSSPRCPRRARLRPRLRPSARRRRGGPPLRARRAPIPARRRRRRERSPGRGCSRPPPRATRRTGSSLRREVLAGQRLEEGLAARPHHPEGRPAGGDVRDHAVGVRRDVAAEPVEVPDCARGRRDHPVPVLGEAGDGEIRLDASALVQPVGVDDPPRFDVHVGGAHPLEHPGRVPPFHEVLGEARLVEEGDPLARRAVFRRRMLEPVLASEGVLVDRLDPRAGRTSWGAPSRPSPRSTRRARRGARGAGSGGRCGPSRTAGTGSAGRRGARGSRSPDSRR